MKYLCISLLWNIYDIVILDLYLYKFCQKIWTLQGSRFWWSLIDCLSSACSPVWECEWFVNVEKYFHKLHNSYFFTYIDIYHILSDKVKDYQQLCRYRYYIKLFVSVCTHYKVARCSTLIMNYFLGFLLSTERLQFMILMWICSCTIIQYLL